MAEVLARRNFELDYDDHWDNCPEDAKFGWIKDAQETLDFLTSAGFGGVSEDKAEVSEEAAAAFRESLASRERAISAVLLFENQVIDDKDDLYQSRYAEGCNDMLAAIRASINAAMAPRG